MNEVVAAALLFTAVGLLFVGLGVPLLRGRVRPNSWYGCRTEKTLADEKVWYAVNRVTGRDLAAGGTALVAVSLALLVFGRGMNPDDAVLALLFVLLLSVAIICITTLRRHNGRRRLRTLRGGCEDGVCDRQALARPCRPARRVPAGMYVRSA